MTSLGCHGDEDMTSPDLQWSARNINFRKVLDVSQDHRKAGDGLVWMAADDIIGYATPMTSPDLRCSARNIQNLAENPTRDQSTSGGCLHMLVPANQILR